MTSKKPKNIPCLIQHRLDYIFISHNFQEVVKNSEILSIISTDHSALFYSFQHFNKLKKGLSTDHSALFYSFQHFNKLKKGSGLWKFINSLVSNEDF